MRSALLLLISDNIKCFLTLSLFCCSGKKTNINSYNSNVLMNMATLDYYYYYYYYYYSIVSSIIVIIIVINNIIVLLFSLLQNYFNMNGNFMSDISKCCKIVFSSYSVTCVFSPPIGEKKEMLFLKIFLTPSHYPLEPFKKSRYSPRDLKSMVLPNQLWY